MAAGEATGSGFRARAGALTLLVVASLEPRERMLEILERAMDGGMLAGIGERSGDGGDLVEHGFELLEEEFYDDEELTPHFLEIAFLLKRWLDERPDEPPEGLDRGAAIATLVCGWSATVTHALAREALTPAELDQAVVLLDRETVEEHLEAMEGIGLVVAETVEGETRYAPTEWLRRGIAPLAAAARLELHFPEEDIAPPDILDVEAAFQLTLPLLRLPPELRGSCRLGVQIPGGPPLMVGAMARVEGGAVVASSPLLEESPDTWATGSPQDWVDALLDPAEDRIAVGGDVRLAQALIQHLRMSLFGPPDLR